LILWAIWFINSFVYLGVILLIPQIFSAEDLGNKNKHKRKINKHKTKKKQT